MAHFQGNLFDTTPLKTNTAHGGDDLSISELSATPQFRWMGDAAPATPGSDRYTADDGDEEEDLPESEASISMQQEEEHTRETTQQYSFDETLRFESSALVNGNAEDAEGQEGDYTETQNAAPMALKTSTMSKKDKEAQELAELRHTIRTMNKSIVQLNGFLKACIPKFEVSTMLDALDLAINALWVENAKCY